MCTNTLALRHFTVDTTLYGIHFTLSIQCCIRTRGTLRGLSQFSGPNKLIFVYFLCTFCVLFVYFLCTFSLKNQNFTKKIYRDQCCLEFRCG